ncbi:PREDICTED: uncharacterized protein LOC104596357 isoform X2 [Nelumbo nucifera]|uniref:Uncharacterized protein LOC104596357 isoform X2 n=1 Tax=Nelumbo nucifera TaxID=4432 RepID=A0A1U8A280_NELNU|nr:PREDICTED: uncharacterized protein LOC104596357 isoform X2 [Nelumbo nucifera]
MDSPEISQAAGKGSYHLLLRCSFALLFSVVATFFLSFVAGFVVILVGNLSISSPISVAGQCKIVSSGVDLRSSKVCELGLLNYNAKHVFYPLERRKFRCHYDYYWASVFKVEYKEHSSGQTRLALAEAPREALPLDCRPSFGTAWLTKDKFKVNETYNCWYTPGFSKVGIYSDNLFNCQTKDPSIVEMMRRSSILFTTMVYSSFSGKGRVRHIYRETLAGLVAGVLTSFISVILVRLLYGLKSRLSKGWESRKLHLAVYGVRIKRACFLVAYFSFMGWLTIQYGKMLGFPKMFINS